MSADKYNVVLMNATDNKNSIFALKISHVTGEKSSGDIYYFNKVDDGSKTIKNLSEFNSEEKKKISYNCL